MLEFAMAHEVICLIVALSLIWACVVVSVAFVRRNTPVCVRKCCDEDEKNEVVAMGGEEEDDS